MVIVILVVIFQILGVISAVHAIMSTRTPQGAIAWAVSLLAVPYVSVPAYWISFSLDGVGPTQDVEIQIRLVEIRPYIGLNQPVSGSKPIHSVRRLP